MGNVDHPEWLSLNIYSGNFQINSDAAAYAMVIAPSSNVNLNGTFPWRRDRELPYDQRQWRLP